MKMIRAKAVLFLMLLFLSISVWSQTVKVSVPVKFMSSLLIDPSSNGMYYLYYLNDYKYGGVYRVIGYDSYIEAEKVKKIVCYISETSPKCKGFKTKEEALQNMYNNLKDIHKDLDCRIEERFNLVNCREQKVEDNTGGDGSAGGGTGSPVDNGNGNSDNDEKPKPNPNQCGKTVAGVWVPMPCDKVDDSENPADSNNSGSGNGGGAGNSSGGGSESGSSDGGNSDSNSDNKNDENTGNTDYVPPKEPSCSPNNPSRNMCNSDKMVSHGDYVFSCVKDKDGKPEYYNFWVSKGVGNIEYCDDGSAHVTIKEVDTYNITIYNNYNSKDDALNASNSDKNNGTDDIYEKFDRDRRNKERERDKNNSSSNAGNNAASQPSGANSSGGNVGGTSGGNGASSGSDGGQCEEGKDMLGCSRVGTAAEVNKAIDGAIDGAIDSLADTDFGIGKHEVDFNTFKKASNFVETGTCPQPKQVTIMKSTHEVSYQQFCDAAIKLRPFIIFSAIFAAFLIVFYAITRKD